MMKKCILSSILPLFLVACGVGGGDDGQPLEDELKGAGGRDLTEFWPEIDIPFSDNAKLLNFEMMRNEVLRATGLSWQVDGVDQWERNRSALGGADYDVSWSEDRAVSQQKVVIWRKMAFTVCGDLVAAEAGQETRTVFDVVDPGITIDTADASVADQISSMWRRFFYIDPASEDRSDSLSLLNDLQDLSGPSDAWRGLCAGYLASMRFLSY